MSIFSKQWAHCVSCGKKMLFCLAQFDRSPPRCSRECLETYQKLRAHSILGNEPIPYEDRPNVPAPDPGCPTCKGHGRYSPYDEQQTDPSDMRTCECWRLSHESVSNA